MYSGGGGGLGMGGGVGDVCGANAGGVRRLCLCGILEAGYSHLLAITDAKR